MSIRTVVEYHVKDRQSLDIKVLLTKFLPFARVFFTSLIIKKRLYPDLFVILSSAESSALTLRSLRRPPEGDTDL